MNDRPLEGVNESCVSWLEHNEDPDRGEIIQTKASLPAVWAEHQSLPLDGERLIRHCPPFQHNMVTANEALQREEDRSRQGDLEG